MRQVKSNRSRWVRALTALVGLLMGISVLAGTVGSPAYAVDSETSINPLVQLRTGDNLAMSVINQIDSKVKQDLGVDYNLLTYKSGNGVVEFDSQSYNQMELSDRRHAMQVALNSVQNSKMLTQNRIKLYNFIAEQDTAVSQAITMLSSDASADVASANSWLTPIYPYVSTGLGLILILIMVFLMVSMVIDLAFMVLPPLRMMMTSTTNGKNRPVFVSVEAWNAVRESENSSGNGTWKHYLTIYLKTRFVGLIIIGMIVGLLVTGHIWDILLFLGNAFA